jgi:dihydroorotase-like cyclic amidohydrolase
MLSSDHSPTLPELKMLDDGNFLKAWGGISSLQVGVFMFRINDNSLYSLVSSTMKLD